MLHTSHKNKTAAAFNTSHLRGLPSLRVKHKKLPTGSEEKVEQKSAKSKHIVQPSFLLPASNTSAACTNPAAVLKKNVWVGIMCGFTYTRVSTYFTVKWLQKKRRKKKLPQCEVNFVGFLQPVTVFPLKNWGLDLGHKESAAAIVALKQGEA